jgi:hypothetical protein
MDEGEISEDFGGIGESLINKETRPDKRLVAGA